VQKFQENLRMFPRSDFANSGLSFGES